MNILHLSDIHFGRDKSEYNNRGVFDSKNRILQELILSIKNHPIKPDHIVVTGDVAWFGKKDEFDDAVEWFNELLRETKLKGENITFCPGNHDVNRAYANYMTELNSKDINIIDQVYQFETVHRMEAPLYNYNKFCEMLGVIPYHYPNGEKMVASYAIGYKDIVLMSGEIFRIVSFNTALLSAIKDYPGDQMLIGQPQVLSLLKHNIVGDTRAHFTIALFHHAERFLHTHEICEYDHRFPTLNMLRRYVDLVLCGHTETGGIPVLYQQIGGARMLTGGAAYYSDDHENSYSMVIITDERSNKNERDVCLLPFTYSLDDGWHQNIRSNPPIECTTIATVQPNFNCRSDFEMLFSYGNQCLSIPLKCVSVFIRDDHTAILNNLEDVCRNLDIVCSGPTDKPGESKVSINIASTKEDSVEASLAYDSVLEFLGRATESTEGSFFKIIDNERNILLSGENISCNEIIDTEEVKFLSKLRKVELKYDLIFQCPKNNVESHRVDVLNDLIDCGYTTSFNAIPSLETDTIDKKQLLKLGLLLLKHRRFYIMHNGHFRCQLYGNDFFLGNATVIMGPYTAKAISTIYKAMTYLEGDKRRISFKLCGNPMCYFITDNEKIGANSLLNTLGKYMQIDRMDCVWDFVYETQPDEEKKSR